MGQELKRPVGGEAPVLEAETRSRASAEARLQTALDGQRRAEEDLLDFVENTADGLHELSPDGIVLWVNQAELDLLGYGRDEYVGRNIGGFHVDAEVIAEILARLARGEAVRDSAVRMRRRDGAIKDVLVNASGLWQHGQFVRARCFTRDVTAQREAAVAADRLGAIVRSSDDAIVSKDLTGIVTSWNGGAERIFGYTEADMIGRSIHVIIPPERRSEEDVVLDRVRRGEAVDHFETVRRRKDGTEVAISLTVSPIRNSSGVIIGASKIARDITDRKRHEADRERFLARAEQARAESERAHRVKDEFLAILSHELRSPLNAISGWAQLASGHMDAASHPTVRRAIEVIERNVALQMRLINDLLDVSRIMSGKLPLRNDVVDLTAVVTAVADSVRPDALTRGISMDWPLAPGRLLVIGDAARLEQVVWNLLSNALKFTPRDGRVTLTLTRLAHDICLTVQDTGEGIAPDFLPHVFGRFRQADTTITRRHGGLGLGLAVVSHLVEAHGGRIDAQSPGPGLGATFTAHFPAAIESPDRTELLANPPGLPLEGLHALVVDDDPDARDLLEVMLRQHRINVTAVGSMGEALEQLHGEIDFAVLLSDLAMPFQDGFALIGAVRGDGRPGVRQIGAVAVTAHADDVHRRRALAAGFDEYVAKPVDATRVVRAIERALRQRGGVSPVPAAG